MVQLSHPYMTTRKTIALTTWIFVPKVISLLFNTLSRASQVVLVVKNAPANTGDIRDTDSIPGLGTLEKGKATHSRILAWRENRDRGAWQDAVYNVTQSWAGLKQLSMQILGFL